MAFCTLAQAELAAGGAVVTRELAGVATVADARYGVFTTECMEDGAGDLLTLIGLQYVPTTIVAPYDRAMANHNASLAAWWMYQKGARSLAMPPFLERAAEAAKEWADRISGRRAVIFTTGTEPSKVLPVKVIDPDPEGQGISRKAFNRSGFT